MEARVYIAHVDMVKVNPNNHPHQVANKNIINITDNIIIIEKKLSKIINNNFCFFRKLQKYCKPYKWLS